MHSNTESERLMKFLMAKRGRPRKRANKPTDKTGRSGEAMSMRIDQKLRWTIDAFIDSQRLKPSITDLIELALQEFFKTEKFPIQQEPYEPTGE